MSHPCLTKCKIKIALHVLVCIKLAKNFGFSFLFYHLNLHFSCNFKLCHSFKVQPFSFMQFVFSVLKIHLADGPAALKAHTVEHFGEPSWGLFAIWLSRPSEVTVQGMVDSLVHGICYSWDCLGKRPTIKAKNKYYQFGRNQDKL